MIQKYNKSLSDLGYDHTVSASSGLRINISNIQHNIQKNIYNHDNFLSNEIVGLIVYCLPFMQPILSEMI